MKKELKLLKPVETYIRAINARDTDVFQSSFAPDAVVQDVGREMRHRRDQTMGRSGDLRR